MKRLHTFLASRSVRLTAIVLGVVLLALLIFHAGMVFGSHRGPFARSDRDDRSPVSFFAGHFSLPHGFIPNNHGAVGTVTALTLPSVTLQTREGVIKTIMVGTTTMIRPRTVATSSALSKGNQIIVLGQPDSQGRIVARFIRVLQASTSPHTL